MRFCSQGGDDSFIVIRMLAAQYKYASIIITSWLHKIGDPIYSGREYGYSGFKKDRPLTKNIIVFTL